jgi:tripartite-type tricarboxylate transporter receptor subunit TctC
VHKVLEEKLACGANRSPFLRDVPNFKEGGIDVEAPNGFAFYAPARTPSHRVVRFEKEIRAAAQIPTVVEKIRSVGFQPTARSSEELKQMQRAQFDR